MAGTGFQIPVLISVFVGLFFQWKNQSKEKEKNKKSENKFLIFQPFLAVAIINIGCTNSAETKV
jgi:hypothetical protein